MAKLYIVVNEDRFFLSHRKDIAVKAQQEGYDVSIVCKDTGQKGDIEALGLPMIDLPVNPTGVNIWEEMRTFRFLYRLYREEKPDIVHHVGIKNILWGGLAARLAKVPGVVNAVSGLGVLFSGDEPSLMARMVLRVMKFSNHRENISVIFQNHEDMDLFVRRGIVKEDDCAFIKGSGVDLKEFHYTPEPDDKHIQIIFTARMVKEKGILVLVKAAEKLRSEMQDHVTFLLCGGLSDNPLAIRKRELQRLCDGKYIKWLDYRSDVRELLMQSHIVTLPSFYREGVPRSLIEANAIGRPIVTTNSIGCKDTVDNGRNGFLVPIKDSDALAEKLRELINKRSLRILMGLRGREKAEKEFSIINVVDKHLAIYRQLSNQIET
ncbi:MAG: glycosyltransferase family 4 protein [Prevotella sp.]|nr:glycosyltransferase family 4 protein [Prevotella sp.]